MRKKSTISIQILSKECQPRVKDDALGWRPTHLTYNPKASEFGELGLRFETLLITNWTFTSTFYLNFIVITSVREVMFSTVSVCLLVCQEDYTTTTLCISTRVKDGSRPSFWYGSG